MSYEVECACGKAHAVSAADAGASLSCACGRTVEVPALHRLRMAAGEAGVSPAVQLQAMLVNNELPGTADCACCHRATDHLIRVTVTCERATPVSRGDDSIVNRALLSGCLLLLTGWFFWSWRTSNAPPAMHGTDLSFFLPVRVCEVCARDLTTPAAVRAALSATAVYAAVLRQYPDAIVRRTG